MSRVYGEGRDANGDVQMCQVWRDTLCGLELFLQITTQSTTYETPFGLSSVQTDEVSATM